jgi:diketogulonate reductase-like aldo/keto reductase
MNRRKFIQSGIIGLAGISVLQSAPARNASGTLIDRVKLGNSGLTVSRIAMGTGTHGYNKSSDQTRLGMEPFVRLVRHAYERGIRLYDMADAYGSMPFVREAIRTLPRENITLLSKMWTQEDGTESVTANIDRYRRETASDYIDLLLMHCMTDGNWSKTRTRYMDGFSRAKQDGIVKAVGVSCHHIDALREAAVHPWVDVVMARINPFGSHMDGTADEIKSILATARENGKGVIGMKIFGEGTHVADDEREQSIRFALTEANVHCMTLGLTSTAQIDDAVDRTLRITAE